MRGFRKHHTPTIMMATESVDEGKNLFFAFDAEYLHEI